MINKKILLHTCCGPCSTAIIDYLEQRDFRVTCFFYNPNIEPRDEYERRLDAVKKYLKKNRTELIVCDEKACPPLTGRTHRSAPTPREKQCLQCYEDRLTKTAQTAVEQNFDYFTTTLLSSPHQDINAIRQIGDECAEQYKTNFYTPEYGNRKYKGFRPLFTESRKLAKEAELYEQTYCGCLQSKLTLE